MRDEAGLAELAAAHHEQVPAGVDVAEAQPAGLAGSQPEPVAEREDGAVGRAAAAVREGCRAARPPHPAADGPGRRRTGTAAGRRSPGACGPAAARRSSSSLGDRPVEQAADHAEQVVEAARPRPGREARNSSITAGVELVEAADAVLLGEAHQQPQLVLFAVVFAAQRRACARGRRSTAALRCVGSSQYLLAVAEGDLAQRSRRRLWRRSRSRLGRAVPDVVADRLQREAGIDESLHAVWRSVCDPGRGTVDPGLQQVVAGRSGDRGRADRLQRGHGAEEDVPVAALRPAVLQVVGQRLADRSARAGTRWNGRPCAPGSRAAPASSRCRPGSAPRLRGRAGRRSPAAARSRSRASRTGCGGRRAASTLPTSSQEIDRGMVDSR